ncbi:MAG: crossover junction endodeoxyribonuclease RuvC [Actinobacteria bacterium]|nr:crossover junction endodeoxyribonuclease RuvC [Actinomycetota bacterium]
MFDSVLGVDPGLASTGLAVVAREGGRERVVWATTVRTQAGLAEAARLRQVHGAVRDAIAEHRPDALALERLMWGRNVGSAMSVARASGVAMLAAAEAGLAVEEYAPLEVKMAVTGVGNAGKDQVRRALSRALRLEVPAQPDAADAVAVAVCHLHQSRLRRLAR